VCGHLYNPQKSAERVRERSKVTFRIHDVRRTVASGLGELGIEEGLISRILNHSTSSTSGASVTAAVYNQYRYVEPMRHALQAWADAPRRDPECRAGRGDTHEDGERESPSRGAVPRPASESLRRVPTSTLGTDATLGTRWRSTTPGRSR
jgi:hypothetical protein